MRRVDQPRPPGTPVGLREQNASDADAPARSVPPAHPAPERPSGLLGGLTRYVPGDRSGRPSAAPAAADTSRGPTTSAPPLAYGGSGSAARMNEAAGHPLRTPQLPQLSDIERARFHTVTTDSQLLRPVRPRMPPTVGASTLRRSPAIRPYRDVLSQWQRHYSADRDRWHSAWRQANSNNPEVERRTSRALKATTDLLEDATGPGQVALELRSVPLPQFPDQAFRLSHLQHMTIDAAGLMELPDAMQQFAGLETLTLARNPIRSLPASIANLSRLRELSIRACPELTELPEGLASTDASGEHQGLVNLQSLRLVRTGIRSLPASIANLQNLKSLKIRNSPLSALGPAIHQLPKLEELDLRGCTALRNYPPIFGGSAPLKRLILKNCSNLQTLPLDIHRLTQLEKLDLRGCVNLSRLPSLIARLPASCVILVPPHLQAQLDQHRQVALELNKVALERIEDTAQAMLSTVIDEERNPFLEGAPSYLPEKRPPDIPTTFGEIPVLQKMLQESRDSHFLQRVNDMAGPSPRIEDPSEEGLRRHYTDVSNWKAQKSAHLGVVDHLGQFVYHEGSPLDAATLAKAVQMWKTRELIVNAHPQDRTSFPDFTLHIPEQVSDDSDDEQPTSPEPSGHQ
ncbi:putative Xanthomonas outer protein L [Xanthomonas citri pv. fuscans]|nr:putative Xanthomonas outer protein L [Xanthomonas citri pv. fuscans]SOO24640.1 putative Xanthomonas outer protein L [Xanthomonas phaseoli pv. phaseoli]